MRPQTARSVVANALPLSASKRIWLDLLLDLAGSERPNADISGRRNYPRLGLTALPKLYQAVTL